MIKDTNTRTCIVVEKEVYRRFQKYLKARAMKFSGWVRLKIEEELRREEDG